MNKDSVKPIGLYVAVVLILFVGCAGGILLAKSRNHQVSTPGIQAPVSSPQPIPVAASPTDAGAPPIAAPAPAPAEPEKAVASAIAPTVGQVPSTGMEDNLLFSAALIAISLYLAFGLRQHRFLYKKLARRA